MKLVKESITMADMLNPRGGLARELEVTAKRASWLSLVCGYWLAHCDDDAEAARNNEPTYNLPNLYRDSKRFNQARKMCGAWDTPNRPPVFPRVSVTKAGKVRNVAGPVHRPNPASRWNWPWVFDHYYDGGLDRGIKCLMDLLPVENVRTIEKELLR